MNDTKLVLNENDRPFQSFRINLLLFRAFSRHDDNFLLLNFLNLKLQNPEFHNIECMYVIIIISYPCQEVDFCQQVRLWLAHLHSIEIRTVKPWLLLCFDNVCSEKSIPSAVVCYYCTWYTFFWNRR